MGGCGKIVAGGIPVLHETLQRVHEPAPEGLAAEERPVVELLAVTQREACEEVAAIFRAGLLESATVAGAVEQMRVDLQFDRRRPPHTGAVGLEHLPAERKLDAMKHAPQSRQRRLAGAVGPQQRGHDVPCNGALGLRQIDQQRKALAEIQLDRAVAAADLGVAERLK